MPKTKCIYKKLLKHFIYKLLYIYISLWTSPSPRENYKSIFNSTLQMQSNIRNLWAMSNSLQPHGLQHARPLCPSPSPKACPSSCPLHQWCHPSISSSDVLFLLLPSIFPSIRVFPNESAVLIRWPKYWSCSFSISPSNEYSGLISLPTDWFDLLAVQGTLWSLLQHHSLKATILW